ncbi:MAG: AraC family transcriptional regulator [Cytophagales bacterium]|nr:AraC family transcriptional regulator [Cytophagales bacterium]
MPTNVFIRGASEVLKEFPFIVGLETVRHRSNLLSEESETEIQYLTFIYICEGKFDWEVNNSIITLMTNDLILMKPGDVFSTGLSKLEQGKFQMLCIEAESVEHFLEKYSQISGAEKTLIDGLFKMKTPLLIQNFKNGKSFFEETICEFETQELGFKTKVNSLIDNLIVMIARALSKQEMNIRDFPTAFEKLDLLLRSNLSHPWTVGEMAGIVGLKTTAFTEKLKFYTGFAPINYLINLRVAEAMRLIRNTDYSMTKIAFETGFYSSQHFSYTFKKLTGFSPKNFRENG